MHSLADQVSPQGNSWLLKNKLNMSLKQNDVYLEHQKEIKDETSDIMKFFAGGWKEELGKRSNIRIYDERGLSNQDYLGQ